MLGRAHYVDDFLRASAERLPEKVALVCDGQRLTYRMIDDRCASLCQALRGAGVRRGDRVAFALENSIEAVVSVFGILRAGAVFVPVPPGAKEDKFGRIVADSGAAALILPGDRMNEVEPFRARCPGLRTVIATRPQRVEAPSGLRLLYLDGRAGEQQGPFGRPGQPRPAGQPEAAPESVIDLDLAALIYTSGSTGVPKGVMLTHRNIVSATDSISGYLGIREDDVIADVLPLSFDYGLYQIFLAFNAGARVVLERTLVYPNTLLQLMAGERVTALPVVPTMLAILLKLETGRYDLSSLRIVTNTGAAISEALIREFRRRLPSVQLFSMYGLTECKRVSYLPPSEIDRHPDSVGRPMPNCEAYIVDENGARVPPGTVGELVVRGSNVMSGYWGMPEETAKVLKPGPLPGERLLYTGDNFRADEEGFLYFVGRRDDVIKSRGEKVSPCEVEHVLHKLDGVAEVIVVGVADEILGQAVKAIVVRQPHASLTEQDVLRHCSRYLEELLVPKHVEFRESLPRTANGKVVRKDPPRGAV